MAKKNIMRAFRLDEISGVDSPAQKGARVTIMKRDDADGDVKKRAALTTEVKGHAHLLTLDYRNGLCSQGSGMTSYVEDHAHPWIVTADGRIVIGEAMGHTHEIAEISAPDYEVSGLLDAVANKRDGTKEVPMADDKTQKNENTEQLQTKVSDLEKRLADATAMAELTDVEKAHYATLDEAGKAGFLKKSKDDRKADVEAVAKAAKDANPVIYTAVDGTEYRKSDDPRLVKMAKDRDEDRKELAKRSAKEALDGFTKRAETELAHFPGTVEVRTAIVKAIETDVKDEAVRKAAFEALKAQDAKLAPAFKVVGAGGTPVNKADGESAEAELDKLAKKAASDDKTDYYTAYEKVSKANPELLKRAMAG